MNANLEFKNGIMFDPDVKKNVRVLSAEGEVKIWRKGNEYAVAIHMQTKIDEDKYTPQAAREFYLHVLEQASKIAEHWKLVDLPDRTNGKVVGQRQITFYQYRSEKL